MTLAVTGLDPVVRADVQQTKEEGFGSCVAAWIAGSSPAMTMGDRSRSVEQIGWLNYKDLECGARPPWLMCQPSFRWT